MLWRMAFLLLYIARTAGTEPLKSAQYPPFYWIHITEPLLAFKCWLKKIGFRLGTSSPTAADTWKAILKKSLPFLRSFWIVPFKWCNNIRMDLSLMNDFYFSFTTTSYRVSTGHSWETVKKRDLGLNSAKPRTLCGRIYRGTCMSILIRYTVPECAT